MNINASLINVAGMVRSSPIKEGETIADAFNLTDLIPIIKYIDYYWRDKRDCPFARGNLIVDITLNDDNIFCLKLPSETTDEQIRAYLQPVLDYKKETL